MSTLSTLILFILGIVVFVPIMIIVSYWYSDRKTKKPHEQINEYAVKISDKEMFYVSSHTKNNIKQVIYNMIEKHPVTKKEIYRAAFDVLENDYPNPTKSQKSNIYRLLKSMKQDKKRIEINILRVSRNHKIAKEELWTTYKKLSI